MSNKQLFSSLELADHEVRLIVGEFFNSRINILTVERVKCDGVSFDKINNIQNVIEAISVARENVLKKLGASVNKVVLAIPSYKMKRFSFKAQVDIEGIDGTVTIQDVRNAIKKANGVDVGNQYALVQATPVKYTVNGISTRRIPLGDKCKQMSVDIDLLCADKEYTYEIVTCVEKAGLEILDIFMDIYAIAKEAALLEQSIDKQIVVLKVERETTTLGLLKQGRYTTSAVLGAGLGNIASSVSEKYALSSNVSVDLLKYNVRLDQDVLSSSPVHIWNDENETHTLSEEELANCVKDNIGIWLDAVEKTCVPILQAGETTVIITGEGGETEGLDVLVQKRLGVETKYYIPDTLGARYAGLTCALGLLYAYQDKLPILGMVNDSIDMDAFIKSVSYRNKKSSNKEDTITNKLKGLFTDGRKSS